MSTPQNQSLSTELKKSMMERLGVLKAYEDGQSEIQNLVKKGLSLRDAEATVIRKSWETNPVSTLGPQNYNLEQEVPSFYSVRVPLLSKIARIAGQDGNAYNFKSITGVNVTDIFSGAGEGRRGAGVEHSFVDQTYKFVSSSLEDSYTWEVQAAYRGLSPDMTVQASTTLINSFLLDEHKNVVGANGTVSLGTTPEPAAAAVTGTGSIVAGDYSVIAVALTPEGFRRSSLQNGVSLDTTQTGKTGAIVPIAGGYAAQSAAAEVTLTATGSITAQVADVAGGFGYAWFVGAAGSERLVALTSTNTVNVLALNGAGQLASALGTADHSVYQNRFTGLLMQMSAPGSASHIHSLDGAPLTSNGAGGVVEIDALLTEMWDAQKVIPTQIYVSAKQRNAMNRIIGAAPAGSGAARLIIDGNNTGAAIGTFLRTYMDPNEGRSIDIISLPDLPDGCVLLFSERVDFSVPEASNVLEMRLGYDYEQKVWPLVDYTQDIAMRTYGALCLRYSPAFGLLKNVGLPA